MCFSLCEFEGLALVLWLAKEVEQQWLSENHELPLALELTKLFVNFLNTLYCSQMSLARGVYKFRSGC